MDVGSSLKPAVASSMMLQHHSSGSLSTTLHMPNSVRGVRMSDCLEGIEPQECGNANGKEH